jgi:hypothetical protein
MLNCAWRCSCRRRGCCLCPYRRLILTRRRRRRGGTRTARTLLLRPSRWRRHLPLYQFLQLHLQRLRPRLHLRRRDHRVLVHLHLPLLVHPFAQPPLMLLQRLFETRQLFARPLGWHACLFVRCYILVRLGKEEPRGPIPHLGHIQRLRERFDLLVSIYDRSLE